MKNPIIIKHVKKYKASPLSTVFPLTFLMEAAPELPEPEYLQEGTELKVSTNDSHNLFHQSQASGETAKQPRTQTHLSVVSALSVSAPL